MCLYLKIPFNVTFTSAPDCSYTNSRAFKKNSYIFNLCTYVCVYTENIGNQHKHKSKRKKNRSIFKIMFKVRSKTRQSSMNVLLSKQVRHLHWPSPRNRWFLFHASFSVHRPVFPPILLKGQETVFVFFQWTASSSPLFLKY